MLSTELIGITDLVAVNLQCFGFIFLGYLSRRSNLIGPEEVKGLNIFVSYFALPAMIFQSLATLPLSNIDYNFVGSILISKSIIFIIVLLFTFQLSYKSCTKYFNIRRSSMFAMFCTQSNDFALGYPLLQSLYGTSKSSLANYLYILAPIQLLILNPIALLLIEVGKNLESPDTRTEHTTRLRRFSNILQIIFQKIFINPIILATFFGILINLLNHQSLPQVVLPFFTVLSQSFSSVALFLLGLNIYGNFKLLNNFSQPLLVTLVLTSIKIFFMPLLNRFLVQHVTIFSNEGQNSTFSEFSFLYGTFPAAPTVYIFSNLYDIETIIISTGLVISTLFSAPLMFVSANMIRLSSTIDYKQLNADLIDTMFYISIASIVGTVLLIFSFFNRYRLRSLTHRYTFKILLSHILVIIGAFLFKFESTKQPQPLSWENKIAIIQYILFHVGLFSLKIWTCFLSFTLVLLYARSLCYTVQILTRFLYTGIFILICYLVMLGVTFMTTIDQTSSSAIDLYYGTNKIHLSISIFSSCFTLISLSISLVFFHRYKNSSQYEIITGTNSSSGLSENENDSNNPIASTSVEIVHDPSPLVEVEDLFLALPRNRLKEEFKDRCGETCHSSCSARKVCTDRFENYKSNIESAIEAVDMSHLFQDDQSLHKDFHQVYHHLYLLLFLALSIIVHLVVEICHLVEDEPTGIYIEIEFLDILLTFSQGFIIFVIFGFDIDHIVQKLSKIFHLSLRLNQIYLPPIRSLNPDTIILCEQFRKFHLKSCKDDVTFTLENDVYFCGKRLIDWLLRKQFVSTREEGIDYGRKLLYGRVLEKICTHQELDSNNYVLRRNNRPVDPSLTLRLASIPLNSELNLVYDANKNVTQPVNISVQYEDRQRRTGQFDPNKTLWDIIATLFQSDCPEVTNDDIVLSINFMNRQFEGKDTLMKTTLKLMGILNGRVALRMNSRDKETKVTQKFVENIIFKKTKPVQEPEVQCKEPETKVEAPVSSAKQETLKTDPEPSCSNEEHRKAEPADFQTKNNNLVQKNSILDHLKDLKQSKSDHKPIDQSAPSPKEKGVEPKLEVIYLDGSNEEILYSIDDCPNFVEENLSDDFFELNPGDLRHLLTQLRRQQKAGENENLEVRKTREERERKEREKFDQTIIRIIFPYDRLALQVIFKPNDTIEMVTNLVRRYINVDNFYLFTAPPKTILSNNLKLVDLNMVPSGSIYCGSATTGICLVQEQFKTKINSFLAASQLASRQIKAMYQKLK